MSEKNLDSVFCDSLPYLNVNSKFEYYMLKMGHNPWMAQEQGAIIARLNILLRLARRTGC